MENGRVYIAPLLFVTVIVLFAFSVLNGTWATAIYDDQTTPRKFMHSLANRDAMMSDVVTIAAGGTVEWDVSSNFSKITSYSAVNTKAANAFYITEDGGTLTVTGTSTDTILITVFGQVPK